MSWSKVDPRLYIMEKTVAGSGGGVKRGRAFCVTKFLSKAVWESYDEASFNAFTGKWCMNGNLVYGVCAREVGGHQNRYHLQVYLKFDNVKSLEAVARHCGLTEGDYIGVSLGSLEQNTKYCEKEQRKGNPMQAGAYIYKRGARPSPYGVSDQGDEGVDQGRGSVVRPASAGVKKASVKRAGAGARVSGDGTSASVVWEEAAKRAREGELDLSSYYYQRNCRSLDRVYWQSIMEIGSLLRSRKKALNVLLLGGSARVRGQLVKMAGRVECGSDVGVLFEKSLRTGAGECSFTDYPFRAVSVILWFSGLMKEVMVNNGKTILNALGKTPAKVVVGYDREVLCCPSVVFLDTSESSLGELCGGRELEKRGRSRFRPNALYRAMCDLLPFVVYLDADLGCYDCYGVVTGRGILLMRAIVLQANKSYADYPLVKPDKRLGVEKKRLKLREFEYLFSEALKDMGGDREVAGAVLDSTAVLDKVQLASWVKALAGHSFEFRCAYLALVRKRAGCFVESATQANAGSRLEGYYEEGMRKLRLDFSVSWGIVGEGDDCWEEVTRRRVLLDRDFSSLMREVAEGEAFCREESYPERELGLGLGLRFDEEGGEYSARGEETSEGSVEGFRMSLLWGFVDLSLMMPRILVDGSS
jgi:hypothetical protein